MALALGMNSGSSFDGIDAAVIELAVGEDGHPTPPKVVAKLSREWPPGITEQVLAAFMNRLSIFDLTRLNYTMGAVYAQTAVALMRQMGLTSADLDVIGVDGQTIYQEPPDRDKKLPTDPDDILGRWFDGPWAVGLQIGDPAVIAAATGVSTVSNYRQSDHAVGGTGAPLMQYLDWLLLRHQAPAVTINIGGICSSTLLPGPSREGILGFDTGPGNIMLDYAMNKFFGQAYDKDGAVSASGEVDQELMEELKQHPFFRRLPPRSAWRLDFGADYAETMITKYSHLAPEDIMATFVTYAGWGTATSLIDYILPKAPITTVIASGGGAKNPVWLRELAAFLPDGIRVTTSAEIGIEPEVKEAVKFATLAFARKRHLATNIPSASGASEYVSMGRMVVAPPDSLMSLAGRPD